MHPSNTDAISIEISRQQIIAAVKRMKREEREDLIEDLIAQASPEYLESIREAREDYRRSRVFSQNEVYR